MLELKRPLVVFDLETTGISVARDRIIEIYLLRVHPDGSETEKHYYLNPGMPIPAESTAIHGITDEQVKDAPGFADVARELEAFVSGCDFAGFNSNRFDFPMLVEEFYRAGIDFDTRSRRFVDAMRIFHIMEPRTLSAAYRFYCDSELTDAHSAKADTRATWEILKAQVQRYEDQLEGTVESLDKIAGLESQVDLAGRMILNDKKEVIFNFGRYKGRKVKDVLAEDQSYYSWMMNGDFALETKKILTRIRLEMFAGK